MVLSLTPPRAPRPTSFPRTLSIMVSNHPLKLLSHRPQHPQGSPPWSSLLGFSRVTNLLTEIPYLLIFPSPCHSSATLRCSWCHWAVLLSSWMFARVTQCLPNSLQQLMNFRVLLYVFHVLRQDSDPCLNLSQRFREVKPVFVYWVAFTRYHGLGGLNNRNLFSHDSLAVSRVDFLGGPLCLTCRWPPFPWSFSWSLLVRTPVIFGFGSPLGPRLTLMTSLRSYLHRQSHFEILGIRASTSALARDTSHNLLKEMAGAAWFTCWQVCPPPQLVCVPRSLARATWRSANITHLLVIEATPRLGGQPFLLLVYIMPPQVLCGIRWSYI